VEKDVVELGLEGVRVELGEEVAVVAAPAGDGAGHAADHLLDRRLALVGAEPAAEVLLGDDVGGVLRPGGGELDAALLEGGIGRVADDRVADLPLDGVERVDAGGGEPSLDADPLAGAGAVLGAGGTGGLRHCFLSLLDGPLGPVG
jgi:hypothetical protein